HQGVKVSNFNKEKFIEDKLKEYAGYIANISKGLYKGDPTNVIRGAQDLMYQLLFDTISNSKNIDEAEKEASRLLNNNVCVKSQAFASKINHYILA
ncbi:hypothetical protein, partial [Campylobacter sp.]|uniref:hypothetical protein n=1 Tax=Campylobacter sp. TaxID=205 RepID=UPI002707B3B9|nr:hypothetical protein [Campylobacter sp.]